MNAEQLQEIIKTFNVTFDGKLNSETLRELTEIIAPYYGWYLVKGFLLSIIGIIAGTICVYFITKAFKEAWRKIDE